jgi:hypothetical protein
LCEVDTFRSNHPGAVLVFHGRQDSVRHRVSLIGSKK